MIHEDGWETTQSANSGTCRQYELSRQYRRSTRCDEFAGNLSENQVRELYQFPRYRSCCRQEGTFSPDGSWCSQSVEMGQGMTRKTNASGVLDTRDGRAAAGRFRHHSKRRKLKAIHRISIGDCHPRDSVRNKKGPRRTGGKNRPGSSVMPRARHRNGNSP